jgi:hypothetical protein
LPANNQPILPPSKIPPSTIRTPFRPSSSPTCTSEALPVTRNLLPSQLHCRYTPNRTEYATSSQPPLHFPPSTLPLPPSRSCTGTWTIHMHNAYTRITTLPSPLMHIHTTTKEPPLPTKGPENFVKPPTEMPTQCSSSAQHNTLIESRRRSCGP